MGTEKRECEREQQVVERGKQVNRTAFARSRPFSFAFLSPALSRSRSLTYSCLSRIVGLSAFAVLCCCCRGLCRRRCQRSVVNLTGSQATATTTKILLLKIDARGQRTNNKRDRNEASSAHKLEKKIKM